MADKASQDSQTIKLPTALSIELDANGWQIVELANEPGVKWRAKLFDRGALRVVRMDRLADIETEEQ